MRRARSGPDRIPSRTRLVGYAFNRAGIMVFRAGDVERSTRRPWPSDDEGRRLAAESLDAWLTAQDETAGVPRTVEELAAAWFEGPGGAVSVHTRRHMLAGVGILPEGLRLEVPALVRALAVARSETTLAPATLHKRFKLLKRLFAWGVDMGYLARNPVALAGMPVIPRQLEPPLFSELHVRMLAWHALNHVRDDAPPAHGCPRYDLLWRFLYYTTCRVGEALALRWTDVSDTAIRITGKGDAAGPRIRHFPLAPFPEVRALLDELRGITGRTRYVMPWRTPPGGAFREARAALGLRGTIHTLRSSGQYRWGTELGFGIELISDLSGHDPSVQVKHYRRARTAEDLARQIAKLPA